MNIRRKEAAANRHYFFPRSNHPCRNSSERRNQITPKSHFKKIKIVFKEFFKDFIKVFIKESIPKNKVWFFSISSNNHEALKLVKNNIDDSIFVVPYSFKLKIDFFQNILIAHNLFL